jgi:hypothetical protein
MPVMEAITELGTVSALMAGISLSAAAGLRVFLPVLALGLASRLGLLELGEEFAWLASDPVLLVVGIAALLEAGAYYIPVVDNLLDTLATPAAIGGGTVIVASLLPEMNGLLQWSTATLLGGGAAGIVQGTTVLARGVSTTSTGGLANPLIATSETARQPADDRVGAADAARLRRAGDPGAGMAARPPVPAAAQAAAQSSRDQHLRPGLNPVDSPLPRCTLPVQGTLHRVPSHTAWPDPGLHFCYRWS